MKSEGEQRPEDLILAIVLVEGDEVADFRTTSVNYNLAEFIARSAEPA